MAACSCHMLHVHAEARHLCAGQSAGLACPIQLSGLLSDIFTRLDRELLQWLQGAAMGLPALPCLHNNVVFTMQALLLARAL